MTMKFLVLALLLTTLVQSFSRFTKTNDKKLTTLKSSSAINGPENPASTPTIDSRSNIKKLLDAYSGQLTKHPYRTKMISAAIVGGTGDLLIQLLNKKNGGVVDLRRWIVFTTAAGMYIAPAINAWFNWLAYLPIPKKYGKFGTAFIQLILDQTVGAVLVNVGFFYAFELIQAIYPPYTKGIPNVLLLGTAAIRRNMWPTLVANWAIWPVINFICFSLIPLDYRVLFSNFAAVFWNMFLSNIANS